MKKRIKNMIDFIKFITVSQLEVSVNRTPVFIMYKKITFFILIIIYILSDKTILLHDGDELV